MGTTDRRYRAANDEAAAEPREKLQSFMAKHARTGADLETSITLIDETLARFNSSLLAGTDILKKAKRIAKAAMEFAKALESTCAIYTDDDGIAREGEESVWPYLRIAKLMGSGTFGDDAASALRFGETWRPARCFDAAVGNAPALLFHVRAIEQQAQHAVAFSLHKRPPDTKTARLRYELESIWNNISGKKPGYSGVTTFDSPRTHFGAFVKLALEAASDGIVWDNRKRKEVFKKLMGRKKPKK